MSQTQEIAAVCATRCHLVSVTGRYDLTGLSDKMDSVELERIQQLPPREIRELKQVISVDHCTDHSELSGLCRRAPSSTPCTPTISTAGRSPVHLHLLSVHLHLLPVHLHLLPVHLHLLSVHLHLLSVHLHQLPVRLPSPVIVSLQHLLERKVIARVMTLNLPPAFLPPASVIKRRCPGPPPPHRL